VKGKLPSILMCSCWERREAFEVFVGDLPAAGSEVADRVVHVLRVPEDEDVEREAERAELVLLAFAVGLA